MTLNPPAEWRPQRTVHQLALRTQCRSVCEHSVRSEPRQRSSPLLCSNAAHCTKPTRGYLVLSASAWGCQQPLAQQDARSVPKEITQPCLYQSHWDECHVVSIHLVPKDHLTRSRTALIQHLGGVRREAGYGLPSQWSQTGG